MTRVNNRTRPLLFVFALSAASLIVNLYQPLFKIGDKVSLYNVTAEEEDTTPARKRNVSIRTHCGVSIDEAAVGTFSSVLDHWHAMGPCFGEAFAENVSSEVRRLSKNTSVSTTCIAQKRGGSSYGRRPDTIFDFKDAVRADATSFVELPDAMPDISVRYAPIVLDTDTLNISEPFSPWNRSFDTDVKRLAARIDSDLANDVAVARAGAVLPGKALLQSVRRVPPWVGLFRDATVNAGRLATCKGWIFAQGGCMYRGEHQKKLDQAVRNRGNLPYERDNVVTVDVPVIPLGDPNSFGYFHLLVEVLPRLALIHGLFRDVETPFNATRPTYSNQSGSLVTQPVFPKTYIDTFHAVKRKRGHPIIYMYPYAEYDETSSRGWRAYGPVMVVDWLCDIFGIPPEYIIVPREQHDTLPFHTPLAIYPKPVPCGSADPMALFLLRQIVFRRLNIRGQQHVSDETRRVLLLPQPVTGATIAEEIRVYWAWRNKTKDSRTPRNWRNVSHFVEAEFQNRTVTAPVPSSPRVTAHVKVSFIPLGLGHASEQVKRFNSVDIVIGPHGANLANVLFMKEGSHVVEIMSVREANLCYKGAASSVGVVHHIVPHSAGRDTAHRINVAPELIIQHILRAIQDIVSFRASRMKKNEKAQS